MKFPIVTFAIFLSIANINISHAEEITVNYKSFYSHVRKLNNEELNALQFAFGFQHIREPRLCKISSARISTEKQQIPLKVSNEYRFTVPSEKALYLAKAKVVINLHEQANLCDMSVQLETKPEYLKTIYQQSELEHLLGQYEAFFDDMGSFLSFMMPGVAGISIHLDNDAKTSTDLVEAEMVNGRGVVGLKVKNGRIEIKKEQLATLSVLKFPSKPLRITATTSK